MADRHKLPWALAATFPSLENPRHIQKGRCFSTSTQALAVDELLAIESSTRSWGVKNWPYNSSIRSQPFCIGVTISFLPDSECSLSRILCLMKDMGCYERHFWSPQNHFLRRTFHGWALAGESQGSVVVFMKNDLCTLQEAEIKDDSLEGWYDRC